MPRLKITDSDYKQYKVRVGDVLIARSGAIGRYGIITKPIKAVFASYIIRFSFNQSKMINNYFGYVYQSDETQEQLLSITQGSSNININAGNIKSLKIKLPSVEEQTAIATILSDMDNEIQTLDQRLTKTRQIKQGMMQELLTGRTRLPY
jgi:type I restriction enzyme S subunit